MAATTSSKRVRFNLGRWRCTVGLCWYPAGTLRLHHDVYPLSGGFMGNTGIGRAWVFYSAVR